MTTEVQVNEEESIKRRFGTLAEDERVTRTAAALEAGVTPVGCAFPAVDVPLTVFVADDPDEAWNEIGEFLLRDAVSYASWNSTRLGTSSVSFAT